jgi:hypothetical protein
LTHHLTKTVKKINSLIPEKLPQGLTEFNNWVDDISELSGLPVNDKLKRIVGMLILQMPPTKAFVPKNKLANLVRKAASNQVAVEAIALIDAKKNEKKACEQEDSSTAE